MLTKKQNSLRLLINLALSLMALLMLASNAPTGMTTTTRTSATVRDSGDCMSQCHMDMSDCLGNGGGHSCIEEFHRCSGGCNQLMQ